MAAAGAAWIAVRQARLQTRRSLLLTAGVDLLPEELGGNHETFAYFVEATNVSWRPITVFTAGFETKEGIGLGLYPLGGRPNQVRLLEGEVAEWWFDAAEVEGFINSGLAPGGSGSARSGASSTALGIRSVGVGSQALPPI